MNQTASPPWTLTSHESEQLTKTSDSYAETYITYGFTPAMRDGMMAVVAEERAKLGLHPTPDFGNWVPSMAALGIPTRPGGNTSASKRWYRWLFDQQGGLCAACRWPIKMWCVPIDHIVPQAQGGTDHICNLQMLCLSCNSSKGGRSQAYLMARLAQFGFVDAEEAKPAAIRARLIQRGFHLRLAQPAQYSVSG